MKYAFATLVLIFLAAGAYWYFLSPVVQETSDAPNVNFEWQFEDMGETQYGQPQTKVSLLVSGELNKTFSVGTYALSCSEGKWFTPEEDPAEVAVITCLWGGGGHEIGVFKEGNNYVVKQGDVDEGGAEYNGFRGNFKTLFVIE